MTQAKDFLIPLLSITIAALGMGFFMTFTTLRLNMEGSDAVVIGLVQGAFYFGQFLAAVKVEHIIFKIGHMRSLAVFASLNTATFLLQAFFPHPFSWILLRLIAGVSTVAIYIIIESWLLVKSTPLNRGTILAFYMLFLWSSQALGQFFLNVIDLTSNDPFIFAALFGALSVIPIGLTIGRIPDIHEPTPSSMTNLYKSSPYGFIGCIISALIISSLYSFSPLFAESRGLEVALFVSLTIGGGMLLQWPVGKISDVIDRRTTLILISVAMMLPCTALIFWGEHPFLAYTFTTLLGGTAFTLYPVSVTHTCDRLDSSEITKATAALCLTYGLGAAIGPTLCSFFMKGLGDSGMYVMVALLSASSAAFGVYQSKIRKPVPLEDQNPFVPLVRTTPMAAEFDPRQEEEA